MECRFCGGGAEDQTVVLRFRFGGVLPPRCQPCFMTKILETLFSGKPASVPPLPKLWRRPGLARTASPSQTTFLVSPLTHPASPFGKVLPPKLPTWPQHLCPYHPPWPFRALNPRARPTPVWKGLARRDKSPRGVTMCARPGLESRPQVSQTRATLGQEGAEISGKGELSSPNRIPLESSVAQAAPSPKLLAHSLLGDLAAENPAKLLG